MKKHICTIGPLFASQKLTRTAASLLVGRIACLLLALAGGIWLLLTQPVAAHPSMSGAQVSATDSDYVALREFARDVGLETASASQPATSGTQDDAYSALLDFAQMVGADAPKTVAGEAPANSAGTAKPAAPVKHTAVKSAKPAKPAFKENKGGEGDAYFVGSAKCLTCHAAVAADFSNTLMGKIGKVRKGTMECENCHGPGSKHVAAGGGRGVGGMMSFRPDDPRTTVEQINSTCLTCHEKGDRVNWRGSPHETRNVACTNCHTVMRNVTPKYQLAKLTEMDTCFQCHKDIQAKIWRSGHMPVREGKMTCTDCHNPHGTYAQEALLKEATVNDVCFKCHAEKRGPFLWEHPPVVENCMNCHDPHGSIQPNMLKLQRPRLCQQCHSAASRHPANPRNPFQIQAINSGCTNCHSQIHGSNSPGGEMFLR